MTLPVVLCVLTLTLPVSSATETYPVHATEACDGTSDTWSASATNSVIQGRVDVLAGVDLKVHPGSDVAKTGRGEWIISPEGGCGQEDLEGLAQKMPNNTRAVLHGHPGKGGLCFFVMEGTREGVWEKLTMHRWNSTPKVETDAPVFLDRELDQVKRDAEADLPWGLDRIDGREGLDGHFNRTGTTGGSGVDIYVIDTGIMASHSEFGGRVVPELESHMETYPRDTYPKDCHEESSFCANDRDGHGTFCAAVIGGRNVGVAPNAKLHAVKVLAGKGETGKVKFLYNAFDRLLSKDLPTASSIFSISLSIAAEPGSSLLNTALKKAFEETCNRGITLVGSAGNHNQDDGWFLGLPEHTGAILVGATDKSDKEQLHNNQAADIYAPGIDIKSAWIDLPDDHAWMDFTRRRRSYENYKTMSGTSAAAPHVAGAAALLLSEAMSQNLRFPPGEVKDTLVRLATPFGGKKDVLGRYWKTPQKPLLYIGDAPSWMETTEAGASAQRTGTEGLPENVGGLHRKFKLVLR